MSSALEAWRSRAPATTAWWIGRYVKYGPVTGDTWHRVVGARFDTATWTVILTLEGGNELDIWAAQMASGHFHSCLREQL